MNMFSDFMSSVDQREAATRRKKQQIKKPFNWFKFFHVGVFVLVGVIFVFVLGTTIYTGLKIHDEGMQSISQKIWCGKQKECKLPGVNVDINH